MSAALLPEVVRTEVVRRTAPGRVVAAAVLGALVLFAVLGPLLLADPTGQDLGRYLEPPSLADPLGTDEYGRSVLALSLIHI